MSPRGSQKSTARFPEEHFAKALLDPGLATPKGLKVWNGSDPALRFAVYRNNVVHSLVDALATTFDVVRQILGEECFKATASVFVRHHPPTSPILARYGETFGDFLGGFAPLADLPYLPDVARLEFLRVQAFHAANAGTLGRMGFESLSADPFNLVHAKVTLHPSVHTLRSSWSLAAIWRAHQATGEVESCEVSRPEAALILREDDVVSVFSFPHASACFVACLQSGKTLGESVLTATSQVQSDGLGFDLPATLKLLIEHHAISACHTHVSPP